MNKFYSLFLAAGSLLTLGVVSSCKDYNEDLYNDLNQTILNERASLAETLQAQADSIQKIREEIEILKKQCPCDFCKNWEEYLKTWMEEKGLINQTQLENALKDYFKKSDANAIIESKVKDLLKDYPESEDFISAVKNTITKEYLMSILGSDIQISGMTEQQVRDLVNEILEGYVKSSKFEQEISSLTQRIVTLENAKDELEKAIARIDSTLAIDHDNIDSIFKRIYSTDTTVLALQGKFEALNDIVKGLCGGSSVDLSDIYAKIDSLNAIVEGLGGGSSVDLSNINATIDSLNNVVATQGSDINAINGVIESLKNTVATQGSDITDIWEEIKELQAKLEREHIWNEAWQAEYDDKIDDVAKDISNALKVATQYTDSMISRCLAGLGEGVDLSEYATLADVKALIAAIEQDDTMSDSIKALKDDISGISTKVDDLEDALNKLTGRMDKVYDRLNAQITSIVIQGSENPLMFNSTFALPLGIQSNILCAYYDQKTSSAKTFPTTASAGLVEYSQPHMTAEELEGVELYNLKGESGFTSAAGKLYFTVNPSNCDFSKSLNGQILYLYDSQNNKCAIRLTEVKKSDKLLTFGASRAANNGFYEAIAEINEEEGMTGTDAKLNISNTELKNFGKDIVNVIKTRQGVKATVSEAAKLAYQTVQIPAYALGVPYRYTDDNDNQVESWIYSNYGIAALAVKPLSYNLDLTGFTSRIPKRIMRHIPHIAAFRDKVKDKVMSLKNGINFKFQDPDFDLGFNTDLNITITEIDASSLTASSTINTTVHTQALVQYELPKFNDDGTPIWKKDAEGNILTDEDGNLLYETVLQEVWTDVDVPINEEVALNTEDLANQINLNIIQDINNQMSEVNDLVADFNGLNDKLNEQLKTILERSASDMNTQVYDIFDDLGDMMDGGSSYINRFDNLIDRVNRMLDRVYGAIEDPTYYLQPIMLMHNDGVGLVSTLPGAMSTYVRFADGVNSIALYPTSYTAEILNPAYKKFVKVTNVSGGTEALCKEAMEYANSAKTVNTVLPGTYRSVPFKSGSKYAGLTYEITYSAMDYAGYQTVQRYYITVVK